MAHAHARHLLLRHPLSTVALALLATVITTRPASAAVAPVVPDSVTGLYIPGWAHNTNPTSLNFFNTSAVNLTGVSHAYYAFLWISDTDHTVYDPFGGLPRLTELKARWPATMLLLSVGGGGFSGATWHAAATTGRTAFVNSMVAVMKAANADGIDLDWEFPGAADRAVFASLCAALRSRLDAEAAAAVPPRRYWLTAATQSIVQEGTFDGYDLTSLRSSIDLFNIMTYTMHDPCYWETQTAFHTSWNDCTKAMDFYIAAGVPRSQLVLGLAFYGHAYTLTDTAAYTHPAPSVESRDCSTMTTPSYRSIMNELSWGYGGAVFVNASERSAYYVLGSRWVGFDVEESMHLKIQGARDYGAGGVMIWDASLDAADGALLRSIASRQAPAPPRPCGGGYIGSGQCADSSQCCSEFGYCGVGDSFCGPKCRGGPCVQYPSPPPRPPAPPPSCGSGVVGSGQCSDPTLCCSVAGWCGTGESWCGVNCAGGPCYYKPSPPPRPPSPPPRPAPPPPPPAPYGCGEGMVGNGTCPLGMCCSASGWCGTSSDYCGFGCKGGPCVVYSPPPPGAGPLCGGGVVGSGQCGFAGQCCSLYGYCGDSSAHCGTGCQGGACWLPPPSGQAASPPPSVLSSSPPPPPPSPRPSPGPPSPKTPSPRPPSPRPPTPPPPTVTTSSPPPPAPTPPPPPPPTTETASSPPPSAVGTCGGGSVGNKICPFASQCCSAAGWCGSSASHCKTYCVGGPCWRPPPPPRLANYTAPASPPPGVPCGDGVVGSGLCALPDLCCSAAGWCAISVDHCDTYCVGGPCWRPPPPPPNAQRRALQQRASRRQAAGGGDGRR